MREQRNKPEERYKRVEDLEKLGKVRMDLWALKGYGYVGGAAVAIN